MRGWPLLPLLLVAAAPAKDPVRQVWTHLPQTRNHCDDVYDYFPGGGLRILYCHAKEDLTIQQVAELAGVKIWASGPHDRPSGLDLVNPREFGHYNPEFVRKIPDFALPASKDARFRQATQSTYDQFLRERARIAWLVHHKLVTDPAAADAELAAYQANLKLETPDPQYFERWFDFAETSDGNVAKTLVGWWIRRRIDGTEDRWVTALDRLLELYDSAWAKQQQTAGTYGPKE